MICYIICDSILNEYTKPEESFGGFINKSLIRFEYANLPLHTIVYGGTGTGENYFIRQYLKLYRWQNQDDKNMVEHQGTCFADD